MKRKLILLCALFASLSAAAQNVGIGTSSPVARLHVADSAVLFTGPAVLPLTPTAPPISGAGTRMMWYPARAAFRSGTLTASYPNRWSMDSVGNYSTALGYNVLASGDYATAFGRNTVASALYATAMGDGTAATRNYATAMGQGTLANGLGATAMGEGTSATNAYATAMGNFSVASGSSSVAMGDASVAQGTGSFAHGKQSSARGFYSMAAGDHTQSKVYSGLAIGGYNDTADNPNISGTNASDRLFQVGNGTALARSNAITLLRNGNTGFGTVAPAQAIDIYKGRLRFTGNPSAGVSQGIEFTNTAGTANNGFVGVYNDSLMGFYGYTGSGWSLLYNNTRGTLGLQGNNNPKAALSFSNASGNKIALWGDADGAHYGMGIQASKMQLYTESATTDMVFGYGSSTAFTENVRMKGNGNVGIGSNNPLEKLEVNGNLRTVGNTSIGGTIKIEGGSPTVNKVLTASNSSGNATWEFPPQLESSFNSFLSTTYSLAIGTNFVPFVDLTVSQPYTGFDLGNNYSNTTNAYTVPAYGFYQFVVKLDLNEATAASAGSLTLALRVVQASSGTYYKQWRSRWVSGQVTPFSLDGMMNLRLNAGDQVSVVVYCSGSSSDFPITVNPGGNTSYFTGYRLY